MGDVWLLRVVARTWEATYPGSEVPARLEAIASRLSLRTPPREGEPVDDGASVICGQCGTNLGGPEPAVRVKWTRDCPYCRQQSSEPNEPAQEPRTEQEEA